MLCENFSVLDISSWRFLDGDSWLTYCASWIPVDWWGLILFFLFSLLFRTWRTYFAVIIVFTSCSHVFWDSLHFKLSHRSALYSITVTHVPYTSASFLVMIRLREFYTSAVPLHGVPHPFGKSLKFFIKVLWPSSSSGFKMGYQVTGYPKNIKHATSLHYFLALQTHISFFFKLLHCTQQNKHHISH